MNDQLPTQLLERLNHIYHACDTLVSSIIRQDIRVAGNIAIFAQNEQEYTQLSNIAKQITLASDNPNQKYFELATPLTLSIDTNGKKATFTHLYIRKPDDSDYGKFLGDMDFSLSKEEYETLKKRVIRGDFAGATMYDRPGWDNIQLTAENIDVVAYISTQAMAEKARIKFDQLTNL